MGNHRIITHRESFVSGLLNVYDKANDIVTSCLINISEEEYDLPIYRIFPRCRLLDVLKTKKLALVRPSMWDDSFENWLLRSKFICKDGSEASIMSSNSFIGQCWSLEKETDAMWRIYSPDSDGVKVKTTISKLLRALINNVEDENRFENSKFIGKVDYLTKDEIKENFRKNAYSYSTTNIGQATSHFFKRPEFSHEKEVVDGIFSLQIEPTELFEEIILDPRLDKSSADKNINYIKSLGCYSSVEQSILYSFENISIDFPI
jgi:hypothetical protein